MKSIQFKVENSTHKEFLELKKKTNIERSALYIEAFKEGLKNLKIKYKI